MKRYDSYKDSGVECIGEIPSHWEMKRFDFLFTFSRGLSITKEDLTQEGVPCVNYGEIHSVYGFEVNPNKDRLLCVDKDYLISSKKSLLKRGDFVFADTSEDIKGSGNFTCLNSDLPTFAGYHTIIASPKAKLMNRYIAYFFESISFRNQIRSKVTGTKVYSITQSILKSTFVELPPLTEQTAIATFLDRKTSEIDQLLTDKKRLLELYEEEKTAIINQAVTKGIDKNVKLKDSGIEWLGEIPEHWEVKRLKYVANIQTGRTPHIQNSELDFFDNGNINWFTPSDISKNEELIESNRKINSFAVTNNEVELFNEFSVFLVSIGATIGKLGYSKTKASANQQINIITFHESIFYQLYGYYFFVAHKEMVKLEADYTTLPILNQTKTKNLLPTLRLRLLKKSDYFVLEQPQFRTVVGRVTGGITAIRYE
jgi:type I restriction enzyme S subunit